MGQKNTADSVPVVDMVILSTLAPVFFLFLLTIDQGLFFPAKPLNSQGFQAILDFS
jgi:hypothetical protein